MPRFSSDVNEILKSLILKKINYNKVHQLLEELKDPLDIIFGKTFIAYWDILHRLPIEDFYEKIIEIENENKRLKDKFIQFMIYIYYFFYYYGIDRSASKNPQYEKYIKYIEQYKKEIGTLDNWEKQHCLAYYYQIKGHDAVRQSNYSLAIKFQLKCIEARSKIPEFGEILAALGHVNLGSYLLHLGDIHSSEKSFNLTNTVVKKFNRYPELLSLVNLVIINTLKGDLAKAKELNQQGIEIATLQNNEKMIVVFITKKGWILYDEGIYDDAINTFQKGLIIRKQSNNPDRIIDGYHTIFNFYYLRFQTTKDKTYFVKAERILKNLRELSETHTDNINMTDITNYAYSLILKKGNVRKRAKAIDILEELSRRYTGPFQIDISLHLLELLFDDVLQTEDKDTINQIDEIMERIGKNPLRHDPKAIMNFISQQILNAKYTFYIKKEPSFALNILYKAKSDISIYKLANLVNMLDAEIEELEREISKWDEAEISINDRIVKSKFSNYIIKALEISTNLEKLNDM